MLTDIDSYKEWNPFMDIKGKPQRPGDRLEVTIRAGKRQMTFKPTVTEIEPGRRLAWVGRLLLPRVFDGAHQFRVESLDGGRSRFTQEETFRGVLVPFMPAVLRDTSAGFVAMNIALRDRAESLVRPNTNYA
jgi:hypothetical protein